MSDVSEQQFSQVVGMDLGDKYSQLCVLDVASGEVEEETRLRTTPAALRRRFAGVPPVRVALEVGTHSPWVSRLLGELGHEVLVANARKLRLIYENRGKDDRVDAQYLARLGRADPKLLSPLQHRSGQTQADLSILRARAALVRVRTLMVNHVRGAVKSTGARLPACSTASFAYKVEQAIPDALQPALSPLLETLASITRQIRDYDRQIALLAETAYPQTRLLQQVGGVGPITALAFILLLENPARFEKSRTVGAYLGLVPARNRSGGTDRQLHITKEGDGFLRRLLVGSAQYILGPFGVDCELRRHGLRIAERGGKNGKKRAVVAVARKLSVLLHRLWQTGEVYDPFYAARGRQR